MVFVLQRNRLHHNTLNRLRTSKFSHFRCIFCSVNQTLVRILVFLAAFRMLILPTDTEGGLLRKSTKHSRSAICHQRGTSHPLCGKRSRFSHQSADQRQVGLRVRTEYACCLTYHNLHTVSASASGSRRDHGDVEKCFLSTCFCTPPLLLRETPARHSLDETWQRLWGKINVYFLPFFFYFIHRPTSHVFVCCRFFFFFFFFIAVRPLVNLSGPI